MRERMQLNFYKFNSVIGTRAFCSEIWGYTYRDQIDKFHLNSCKFFLGVGQQVIALYW